MMLINELETHVQKLTEGIRNSVVVFGLSTVNMVIVTLGVGEKLKQSYDIFVVGRNHHDERYINIYRVKFILETISNLC